MWRFALVLAACSSSSPKALPPTVFGGDRPATLQVPAELDGGKVDTGRQYPLVMVLHGYGASGFVQEAYFGMNMIAPANLGFVIAPDGLTDSTGNEYWNADPACCDFDHANPDDSGYLGGLIDDIEAAWPAVDPGAMLVIGHSNGGYMAYRMACDHADTVTNIIVLAGAAASDPSTCNPTLPVAVLHMHGTADTEVPYVPNAAASVMQWAGHDGCATTTTAGANVDLDQGIPGAETTTESYDDCPPGTAVDLWSIQGGTHIPSLDQPVFAPMMMQYFQAHRRLLPD
ncbi:MAG TPA: hypothetical protein VMJ10_04060 [Kofleriaceae bacterium]|nr:hypothetical protein [Kofleriaceae bacterium]